MNRVFINDVGVISALGLNVRAFYQGLKSGVSGIKKFSRFDPAGLLTQQGGEVDLSALEPPPAGRQQYSWQRSVDPKAFLAWNALCEIRKEVPVETPLFCAVGLERVDIGALLAPPAKPMTVCPEFPPTLLPGFLWEQAGFRAPVFPQVSACAAGIMAIGHAFQAIRHGFFPWAVAGGVDSMLFPYGVHAFNSLGALSERNDLGPRALAPFDKKRSGTLLGEGAAFLVLASEEAVDKGMEFPIAEIVGFGTSMDAHHPVMPDPDGRGAVLAMRRALQDAGVVPEQIDYVNAHGTGTIQNDLVESKAILEVFGERGKTLPVSSLKPFFGHLLSASGAVETAGCLLPFLQGLLPPTLHWETADPACPIDCIPNAGRPAHPQYIMKNSYGFGGQNASIILKKLTEVRPKDFSCCII